MNTCWYKILMFEIIFSNISLLGFFVLHSYIMKYLNSVSVSVYQIVLNCIMIYKIEIVQSVSNMNSDYSDVMLFFDSSFCSSFTNNRFITTNVLTDRNKKWFAIFPHYNEVNYFFNAFPSNTQRQAGILI